MCVCLAKSVCLCLLLIPDLRSYMSVCLSVCLSVGVSLSMCACVRACVRVYLCVCKSKRERWRSLLGSEGSFYKTSSPSTPDLCAVLSCLPGLPPHSMIMLTCAIPTPNACSCNSYDAYLCNHDDACIRFLQPANYNDLPDAACPAPELKALVRSMCHPVPSLRVSLAEAEAALEEVM